MADVKLWWPGVYSTKKDGGLLPFKVNSTSIQEAVVIGLIMQSPRAQSNITEL